MVNDAWGRGRWGAGRGNGVRGDKETLEEWGRRLSGETEDKIIHHIQSGTNWYGLEI